MSCNESHWTSKRLITQRWPVQLNWFFPFFILKHFFINYCWDFRAKKFLSFARLLDISAYLEKKVNRKAKHMITKRRSLQFYWFFQFLIQNHFFISYCCCFRARKFLFLTRLADISVCLEMKVTREANHWLLNGPIQLKWVIHS